MAAKGHRVSPVSPASSPPRPPRCGGSPRWPPPSHAPPHPTPRARRRVRCIDANCYHQGAEIGLGDIEEIAGRVAITCPRHRHKIDLETGQRIETDLDGTVRTEYGGVAVQAVHEAIVDDGYIWVRLNPMPCKSAAYSACAGGAGRAPAAAGPPRAAGWGLSGDMFSPAKPGYGAADPLNDTFALSQDIDDLSQRLSQSQPGSQPPPEAVTPPRAHSPPEPPAPLEPYGGWGMNSLGNMPGAVARRPEPALHLHQQGPQALGGPGPAAPLVGAAAVPHPSPQQRLTHMFRARSNAARQAVLKGKIAAPTSYDAQHKRGPAEPADARVLSGVKRNARAAEIPSPIRPPMQRPADEAVVRAGAGSGNSPRRGLNFDMLDF